MLSGYALSNKAPLWVGIRGAVLLAPIPAGMILAGTAESPITPLGALIAVYF